MKKYILIGLMLFMVGCADDSEVSTNENTEDLTDITLVLDWVPNTNHTGLYVAKDNGYYEDMGLNVDIVMPPEDGASMLVASGKADFGITAQDSMLPAITSDNPLPIKALATIIQHNTSGIISAKDKGIETPKDMANHNYATWNSPIEKAIIKTVVENDGGNYDNIEMIPSTVTDVISALSSDIDSVWIFYGWDGIATELANIPTNYFEFRDYDNSLDYYTPVIISSDEFIENNPDITKDFLTATQMGYEYAIENPTKSAEILYNEIPDSDKDLIMASQEYLSDNYIEGDEEWGIIDTARWDSFFYWAYENNIIDEQLPSGFGLASGYLGE